MSNTTAAEVDPELLSALNLTVSGNYCEIAAFTLLFFDHLLTLPGEVKLIWGRKFAVATVLFALNRYVTLLSKVFLLLNVLPWPGQTDKLSNREAMFVVAANLIVASFSALRVYAIWNKDWRPFVLILAVGIVAPATNIYHYSISTAAAWPYPMYGCAENFPGSEGDIARHSSLIAMDALVLVCTWMKTFGMKRLANQLNMKSSLSSLVWRDGTIYFMTLLVLNIVDLAILQSDVIFDPLPNFVDVFTSILISRFMLSLREATVSGAHPANTTTDMPSIDFTTVPDLRPPSGIARSMGGSLDHNAAWIASPSELDSEMREHWQMQPDVESHVLGAVNVLSHV